MYRVWIEYKSGTSKEEIVSNIDVAERLKAAWEEQSEWKDSGYALVEQPKVQDSLGPMPWEPLKPRRR